MLRTVRAHPLRVAFGVAIVWMLAAGAQALLAYRDIDAGVRAARSARAGLTAESIIEGNAIQGLQRSRASFARAHRRASGAVLWPVRLAPVAGRQLRSAIALSGAADEVTTAGVDALTEARRALRSAHRSGSDRVRLVRRLADALADADRRVQAVRLGPAKALVAPLADRRTEFSARLAEVREALARAASTTNAVATFLAGPRRYLLLAANNAEMRAGSGMFLSAGMLTTADGALTVGEMVWTADLHLEGDGVPIPEDLQELWGAARPGSEWRNLAMTPRFDATAEIAARMWKAKTGEDVDGVLALDVVAVRAIVAATGPVRVGGTAIGVDNAVRYLSHDQYAAFGGTFDEARAAREDSLGRFAKAAVEAIEAGKFDAEALATGLAKAAAGRHVLAWSARSAEQAGWQSAGVAGELRGDSLMVSVLNTGGNKLDQFLRVRVGVEQTQLRDDVELTITLENRVPRGEPTYVAGPHSKSEFGEGVYVGLVAVNLPGNATDAAFASGTTTAVAGLDGPTIVLATQIVIARGERKEVVLRFRAAGRRAHVEPSARLRANAWRAGELRFTDATARTLP